MLLSSIVNILNPSYMCFLGVLVWGKYNPPFFSSILLLRQNRFVTVFHSSQGRLRSCKFSLVRASECFLHSSAISPTFFLISCSVTSFLLVLPLLLYWQVHSFWLNRIVCLPVLRLADTKVNKTYTCYSQGTYNLIRER